MATIQGIYDLIKADQKAGKPLSVMDRAILEAVESENKNKKTREISVTFQKNKDQNINQSTQNQIQPKK